MKIRKLFVNLFVAVLFFAALAGVATASAVEAITPVFFATETSLFSEIDAEQTEWFFRVVNGSLEKRLWSLTYAVWLTDWMPV